jgi:hypothetical protein
MAQAADLETHLAALKASLAGWQRIGCLVLLIMALARRIGLRRRWPRGGRQIGSYDDVSAEINTDYSVIRVRGRLNESYAAFGMQLTSAVASRWSINPA